MPQGMAKNGRMLDCPHEAENACFRPAALNRHERMDDLAHAGRRIIQNTREFCFSMDAVLLAHFPSVHKGDRMLDLGTGTGILPLLLADEAGRVDAIEYNPVMASLARRNIALNALEEKVRIIEGDYRKIRELCPPEQFDLVLANPPYYPAGQGRNSQRDGTARHELTATLADTVQAAAWALRFHGRLAMVHIPERLGEICVALHERRLELKRLRFVQPRAGKAPNLLLLEAVKGAAPGGLRMLAPLAVRNADGSYTEEIKEIYGKGCDGIGRRTGGDSVSMRDANR